MGQILTLEEDTVTRILHILHKQGKEHTQKGAGQKQSDGTSKSETKRRKC